MKVKSLSKQQLMSLPKVEFHRHLDGSVRFETICELARANNLDLGVKDQNELYHKCKILSPMDHLQAVLDCFWTTQKVLCHYEAIKRVAYENVEDAYYDGVKLLELRFAMVFIAQQKKLAWDEIMAGVIDGVKLGREKYPIEVGLIHILPRSLSFAENQSAHDYFLRYHQQEVLGRDLCVGVDLADAEKEIDSSPFIPLMAQARNQGLGITIHSGEDTDHHCMEKVIAQFNPQRIGHGVRAWGHSETMDLIKSAGIHLELCPSSNVLTQAVESIPKHPFVQFWKSGIKVSLNTDDPHLMNLDLIHEYELMNQVFHMGPEDFFQINQRAVADSFLDGDRKKHVLEQSFSGK